MSHPTRGAWIETRYTQSFGEVKASHPTRGAWIETRGLSTINKPHFVAPHPGCVD